jgi:hypothetical protein
MSMTRVTMVGKAYVAGTRLTAPRKRLEPYA